MQRFTFKLVAAAALAAMAISLTGCLIIVRDTKPAPTPPPAEKTSQKTT